MSIRHDGVRYTYFIIHKFQSKNIAFTTTQCWLQVKLESQGRFIFCNKSTNLIILLLNHITGNLEKPKNWVKLAFLKIYSPARVSVLIILLVFFLQDVWNSNITIPYIMTRLNRHRTRSKVFGILTILLKVET